jgi:hypothetical protein
MSYLRQVVQTRFGKFRLPTMYLIAPTTIA